MRFFSPIRPLLRGWLISFLCFGLLAVAFIAEFSHFIALPVGEALWLGLRDWVPWAIFTPLLFRLCNRFPLERGRWMSALPIHLAVVVVTTVLSIAWAAAVVNFHRTADITAFTAIREQRPPSPPGDGQSSPMKRGMHPGFEPGRILGFSLFVRLPLYVTILSLAHAVYFYRRSEERERRTLELTASLAQSRLEALKMQLQPHFLFNTLNSIAELVHRDADAADEMLASLSDLLRLTLETANDQELPLRRELEFVERYLAVEQVRFRDRLKYELEIAADTKEALVPAFLLQPLVENAVRHGIEPRSSAGLLTIQASRKDDLLHLRIGDNGPGLPKEHRERVGLSNARARLHALYGTAASLDLLDASGLTVEIALPFRTSS